MSCLFPTSCLSSPSPQLLSSNGLDSLKGISWSKTRIVLTSFQRRAMALDFYFPNSLDYSILNISEQTLFVIIKISKAHKGSAA